MRTDFFSWSIHIISPIHLLWGRWGFGLSVAGPHDGISFALGPVHIALAIAGALIGIRAVNRTRRLDAMVFAGAALAGALMATEWTAPIWARIHTLQYLQFPWRTLFLPALFVPLLALYAFERIGSRASVALIVLIVLVNLHHTQPKGYEHFDDEYFQPASIAARRLESTTRGEYVPRWAQVPLQNTGAGLISADSRLWARALSSTSTRHAYSVVAPSAVAVMEPTDYYPGWTVLIDHHPISVSPAPAFGMLAFVIPRGRHLVEVELRPTRVRRVALLISVLTFALLLLALAVAYVVRVTKCAPLQDPTEAESRVAL